VSKEKSIDPALSAAAGTGSGRGEDTLSAAGSSGWTTKTSLHLAHLTFTGPLASLESSILNLALQ